MDEVADIIDIGSTALYDVPGLAADMPTVGEFLYVGIKFVMQPPCDSLADNTAVIPAEHIAKRGQQGRRQNKGGADPDILFDIPNAPDLLHKSRNKYGGFKRIIPKNRVNGKAYYLRGNKRENNGCQCRGAAKQKSEMLAFRGGDNQLRFSAFPG
jgi:hypothetical protein